MVTFRVKSLQGLGKIRGLIGPKKASPVYFKTHFGIHTFGLKFPIDVLILDSGNQIVRLVKELSPNHVFIWPVIYNRVIELPTGTISQNNLKIGDKMKLIFLNSD